MSASEYCGACGAPCSHETWPFCRPCRAVVDAHPYRWADDGVVKVDASGEQVWP